MTEELKQKAKDFIYRITKESGGDGLNEYYLTDLLVIFATETTKELQESLVEWQRTCEAKSNTNSQLIEQLADKNEQLTEAKEIIAEWEDSFCCGANYLYLGDKGKELRVKSQKFLNNKS